MKKREKFLRKLNEAFAECNADYLAKSVTDDITWVIVGEKIISGREEFEEALERMKEGGPMSIEIVDIILDDQKAVVEGVVEAHTGPGKFLRYAFCDIYVFRDGDNNKVQELRTFVAKLKNK